MNQLEREMQPRPEISQSWKRSRMCGLNSDGVLELPYRPEEVQRDGRLMRAAAPVLDSLCTTLSDKRIAVALNDDQGRLLARQCADSSFDRILTSAQSEPGFVWSEEFCGTNGVGMALEEKAPAWVAGAEHFFDALHNLVCAAVPVTNPVSGRILGGIDIAAQVGHDSPLMMPLAIQSGKEIEDRLLTGASLAEQALLARFLTANRQGRATLVVGDTVELSSSAASSMLDAVDRVVLLEKLNEMAGTRSGARTSFELSNGNRVTASFQRIEEAGGQIGLLIDLEPLDPRTPAGTGGRAMRTTVPGSAAERFTGRSSTMSHLRQRATELAVSPSPVLVTGEASTGKLTLAKVIAGPDAVLLDATRASIDGEDALLREATALLDTGPRTVIIRRVRQLGTTSLRTLAELTTAAENSGARVIATAEKEQHEAEPSWFSTLGVVLEVPPLREHLEDVPDLITHLMARRGSQARIPPPTIQVLMRHEWPGNVRELDHLLCSLAPAGDDHEITVAELPVRYQRGKKRLSRIEHTERATITQAMIEADGNKTKAARLLEIGRATLYRKMQRYGIAANDYSRSGQTAT